MFRGTGAAGRECEASLHPLHLTEGPLQGASLGIASSIGVGIRDR